jgi:hypothetical protein
MLNMAYSRGNSEEKWKPKRRNFNQGFQRLAYLTSGTLAICIYFQK